MELEIVRRIRGNVHGTVDVTALEDRVIDHPTMQRLRRIRQLAFLSFVFPGATHSRFEHSLGVMQLAGITWSKMRANQMRLVNTCGRYHDFARIEQVSDARLVHGLLAPTFPLADEIFGSPYILQALRLAGLLHDVGHPPFSHSGERFLPSYAQVLADNQDIPPYLTSYLEGRCRSLAAQGRDPAQVTVRHETYTLLLAGRLLEEVNLAFSGPKIEPRDVVAIINPEIAPAAGSPLARHGLHHLLHELVSGEVDVDRMDYLLRDARECGVVYGIFDATRIQDSLCLYFDPLGGGVHLAISFSGLAAFEDYLRARHSMYLQLYFHKTSVAAEAMMQHLARMLGGYKMPARLADYAALDEYNIEGVLLDAARNLSAPKQAEFRQLLDDLLRGRRLWKRVFEVSTQGKNASQPAAEQAAQIIKELGVAFEQVSSSGSLTNFRPRREHELSRNYLRLIKKDEYQFPRVLPIEDHLSLISGDTRVHINRIYVESGLDGRGRRISDVVKQRLTERLRPANDGQSPLP